MHAASRNIVNVLRHMDQCICFADDDGARGVVCDAIL
jgi:hypothetical protein